MSNESHTFAEKHLFLLNWNKCMKNAHIRRKGPITAQQMELIKRRKAGLTKMKVRTRRT
jgi:hypothetical protein